MFRRIPVTVLIPTLWLVIYLAIVAILLSTCSKSSYAQTYQVRVIDEIGGNCTLLGCTPVKRRISFATAVCVGRDQTGNWILLTCEHVTRGATEINIGYQDQSGNAQWSQPLQVIGSEQSKSTDLTILKANAVLPLKMIEINNNGLPATGDIVSRSGFPLGKSFRTVNAQYLKPNWTSSAAIQGESGGPVIWRGKLIGIIKGYWVETNPLMLPNWEKSETYHTETVDIWRLLNANEIKLTRILEQPSTKAELEKFERKAELKAEPKAELKAEPKPSFEIIKQPVQSLDLKPIPDPISTPNFQVKADNQQTTSRQNQPSPSDFSEKLDKLIKITSTGLTVASWLGVGVGSAGVGAGALATVWWLGGRVKKRNQKRNQKRNENRNYPELPDSSPQKNQQVTVPILSNQGDQKNEKIVNSHQQQQQYQAPLPPVQTFSQERIIHNVPVDEFRKAYNEAFSRRIVNAPDERTILTIFDRLIGQILASRGINYETRSY